MKLTKIQRKRLLNVARACDEAEPKYFTMKYFGWDGSLLIYYADNNLFGTKTGYEAPKCGTPACALGNYAARGDLQRKFKLAGSRAKDPGRMITRGNREVSFGEAGSALEEFFGLEHHEIMSLFDAFGNMAMFAGRDPKKAAKYIRYFVKNHE